MATTEEVGNLALDDIIKNSKKEKYEQRNQSRPQNRGGRGRFVPRGNSERRPYRERSREHSRERRGNQQEDSRPAFPRDDNKPRKKIIIRKRSELRRDDSRERDVTLRRPKLPPQVDSFSPSETIKVENFPAQINMHDMIELFRDFGTVRNLSINWTKKRFDQCTVFVEFSSSKEATKAHDHYDRAEMEGHTLKISFLDSDSE